MEMMIERRGDLTGRVPLRLPIELEFAGTAEPFEADAVDISSGGLSLRSASLPAMGTKLTCRFDNALAGARLDAEGEVVWTRRDGARSGEFGVRFLEVSHEQRALISEMIAELETRGRHDLSGSQDASEQKPVVLTLDASQAEIEGHLAECSDQGARFEQPLSLLEVGQGLWLQEEGRPRHAHISSVSLRLEGKTPLLAVQVAFDEPHAEGKASANDDAHDTVPDMEAPAERFAEEFDESVHTRPTLSGAALEQLHDALDWHADAPRLKAPPSVAKKSESRAAKQVELPLEQTAETVPRLEPPQLESATASTNHQRSHAPSLERDDVSICFDLSDEEDEPVVDDMVDAGAEEQGTSNGRAHFRAALEASPLFQQGGIVLVSVAYASRLTAQARERAQRFYNSDVRKAMQQTTATAEWVIAKLFPPKRRTAGKARRDNRVQRISRRLPLVVAGLLAATGVALLTYALTPEPDPLLAAPPTTQPSTASAPASDSAQPVNAKLPKPSSDTAAPSSAQAPTPNVVPAHSPYAIDVNAAPAKTPVSSPSGPSFGAKHVSHAQTYKLRMTANIKELQGVPDQGGFSVIIPGALSLDRAGPIAAAHPGVQRSMILNKGDHAELTIRFAEGKKPSYRVSTHGSELILEIGR